MIIVGRGGGSLEDLWPFNEEVVARAIYACKTPVVSAVGHETDETIADYVADVRAPTPSAAAELVVPDGYVLQQNLAMAAATLHRLLNGLTFQRRSDLVALARRMETGLPDTQILRRRVDDIGQLVQRASERLVQDGKTQVEGLSLRLRALDPAATLDRGFSIVELPDSGQVVTSAKQVSVGDALAITVADGSLAAIVGTTDVAPKPVKPRTKAKAKTVQPNGMVPLL